MEVLPSGSKTPLSIWAMVSPLSVWAGLMRYTTSRRKRKITGNGYLKFYVLISGKQQHIRNIGRENAGSTEIKPTIEIQSILDLLFIGAQVQKIYKGLYVNLDGADLYGARFLSANLQQASLWDTNLQNAILVGVNLHGAYLVRAKLQNANLWDANLQGAHLVGANLQNADLNHVNLTDANLMDANLRNVDLTTARNLEVKQLLKAKTLYKADLPVGMKKEIEKEKPGLLDDPEAKQES